MCLFSQMKESEICQTELGMTGHTWYIWKTWCGCVHRMSIHKCTTGLSVVICNWLMKSHTTSLLSQLVSEMQQLKLELFERPCTEQSYKMHITLRWSWPLYHDG